MSLAAGAALYQMVTSARLMHEGLKKKQKEKKPLNPDTELNNNRVGVLPRGGFPYRGGEEEKAIDGG